MCGNLHIWEADAASGHWLLLDATGPVGVLCIFGPEGLKEVSRANLSEQYNRKELSYEDEALIYLAQQISRVSSSTPKSQKVDNRITGIPKILTRSADQGDRSADV